jgi:hypothetical protein
MENTDTPENLLPIREESDNVKDYIQNVPKMDNKLKQLVWKLDREVWSNVPGGGQREPWTDSKARQESAKLILDYVQWVRDDEMNKWKKVIDEQRITLSQQYERILELEKESAFATTPQKDVKIQFPCFGCGQHTSETNWLGCCSQECMTSWFKSSTKNGETQTSELPHPNI